MSPSNVFVLSYLFLKISFFILFPPLRWLLCKTVHSLFDYTPLITPPPSPSVLPTPPEVKRVTTTHPSSNHPPSLCTQPLASLRSFPCLLSLGFYSLNYTCPIQSYFIYLTQPATLRFKLFVYSSFWKLHTLIIDWVLLGDQL